MSMRHTNKVVRVYKLLVLTVVLVGAIPSGRVFGQTLQIVPADLIGAEDLLEGPPVWQGEGEFLLMSFAALLRVEDPDEPSGEQVYVVTDLVAWSTDSATEMLEMMSPGEFRVFSPGHFVVRGDLAGLVAEIPIEIRSLLSEELSFRGAGSLPPPVSESDLRSGAEAIFQQLTVLGVPGLTLQSTLAETRIVDSVSFASPMAPQLRVDWLGQSGDGGHFLEPNKMIARGSHWTILLGFVGLHEWTYVSAPTIVLRHDNAVAVAAAGGVHEGGLSEPVQALIHELVHARIHENGWDLPFDPDDEKDPEERIAVAIEGLFVRFVVLAKILENQPLTWHDKYTLRQQLIAIRVLVNELRQVGVEWGLEAIIEELLRQLGIEDDDGNGLPDYIDDILHDLGINEEDLPTTPQPPEGSGPCGPLEPTGGGGGSKGTPSVVPGDQDLLVDPCGQVFQLFFEEDGSLLAVRVGT